MTNVKRLKLAAAEAGRSGAFASLDLSMPSSPANSFITDICVWFLLDRASWLPASTWVTLLGDLGIPDATARTGLHRMTKAGYLERGSRDGRAGYGMSQAWVEYVRQDDDDPEGDDQPANAWVVVVFSIPEARRSERHALRTVLS